MELISRDELKEKLDRKDNFKLAMVLGEWAYRAKHIPGSLNVFTPERAKDMLDPEDDAVIYCADENCPASKYAYMILTNSGFHKVRRYAGGIADWEEAGYPMEGEMVK